MSESARQFDLPIACSLGSSDLRAREAELAALGRRSLISVDRRDGSVTLNFTSDPETKAELERVVAAEAECCAFLTMTITVGNSIRLAIDGPDDAAPIIEELVDAFAAEAAA
jgi:hypothetical protein